MAVYTLMLSTVQADQTYCHPLEIERVNWWVSNENDYAKFKMIFECGHQASANIIWSLEKNMYLIKYFSLSKKFRTVFDAEIDSIAEIFLLMLRPYEYQLHHLT